MKGKGKRATQSDLVLNIYPHGDVRSVALSGGEKRKKRRRVPRGAHERSHLSFAVASAVVCTRGRKGKRGRGGGDLERA